MAIIHCGLVPHQNKRTNQRLISQQNSSAEPFPNEIIAEPLPASQKKKFNE